MADVPAYFRCPSCLRAAPGRLSCCGSASTVPALDPLLPERVWGHVVQGRPHPSEVAARLLQRVCSGHSPQRQADAACLFAACRATSNQLAWLWQTTLDNLFAFGEPDNARALSALGQSSGLVLELTALPTGGVAELEDNFEQLHGLLSRITEFEDGRLPRLALVCRDLMHDEHAQFDIDKHASLLAKTHAMVGDISSALEFLLAESPPRLRPARRPATSTHVRVVDLGGNLSALLLNDLHSAKGQTRAAFVTDAWSPGQQRPPAAGTARRLDVPAWRGFRGGFARRQAVQVELTDVSWLLHDEPAPLIACLGDLSTKSEMALHCLALRAARSGLQPSVLLESTQSAPDLVRWCREFFPGVRVLHRDKQPIREILSAALSDVPLPPLLDLPIASHWLSRLWPFRRDRMAA